MIANSSNRVNTAALNYTAPPASALRDQDGMQKALESLPQDFSEIDILVNNAGLALGLESADKANLADWEEMMDTNIKGLVGVTRLVLPGMVARNRGHVVNLGSIAGKYPYSGGNVYGGIKAFVYQFSANLRTELLGKSIRVTCIEPGLSETEFSLVRFKGDVAKSMSPYGGVKALCAEDIAGWIVYVTQLPEHVNVNVLEVMPVMQAAGGEDMMPLSTKNRLLEKRNAGFV